MYEIDGVKLGSWLDYQRQEYRKHIEGKPANITQERINELNAIGVEWCPGKSKKIEEDKLSVDEYPSGDGKMPTMTRRSSRRTRNPPSDRHSSAITNTSSASHPRSGRRQASHSKTRRLNDQSRMTITPERTLVSRKDIKPSIDDAAGFQEEESPARSCQLSNRRAPSENRVTRSKGSSCTTTKTSTNCYSSFEKESYSRPLGSQPILPPKEGAVRD